MMISAILSKAATPLVIGVLGLLGGYILKDQIDKPQEIKTLSASEVRSIVAEEIKKFPKPQVSVQPFEMEKMKNVKGFTYSPQFTGSIEIAGMDSTKFAQICERSFEKVIDRKLKGKFLKTAFQPGAYISKHDPDVIINPLITPLDSVVSQARIDYKQIAREAARQTDESLKCDHTKYGCIHAIGLFTSYWSEQLDRGEITPAEFKDLVQSRRYLLQMKASRKRATKDLK